MGRINLTLGGQVKSFDDSEEGAIAQALGDGWKVEAPEAQAARSARAGKVEGYGVNTVRGQVKLAASEALGGASGGLTQLAEAADPVRREQMALGAEEHPYIAGAANAAGVIAATVAGVGPIGKAAKVGQGVARAAEGAGTVARIARAGAGSAIEGGAIGLGEGVRELALSEEPISVERAVSTLTSKGLYSMAIGGAAGSLAKGAEIGLVKGRAALDEIATKLETRGQVADDLANLDAKGLRAAEAAERDAIEAARVPERAKLADEITAFRRELKANKQFLTTKDVELPAVGDKLGAKELGRIATKANKQLDNVLDNPAGLMKNPAKALDALQRQENALAKLYERGDDLRTLFAADTSGTRMAALDTVGPALERNRALQSRIAELTSEAASPRLQQIAAARDAIASGGPKQTLAGNMAGAGVFSAVTGAVAMLPLPGTSIIAPMIGAKAAQLVNEKVFGRLGKAMIEGEARSARAVAGIFEKGSRAVRAGAPIATRTLTAVAFAPEGKTERTATPTRPQKLPEAYKARAAELREQVATGPMGPVVRPHVRKRIADSLGPIGTMQPMLADRMETLAVKRLEFLAGKLPRRPEIGAMQLGPDNWQPSDMEMRTFARFVAAAEDPDGILERVAQGNVTPEDAETMRTLYPEQLADVTRQILERLPTLQVQLPYHRRLALSVLTGVPVDPSMDPRILAVLQSQFAVEPEPPKPSPQFGSVSAKNEVGTLSERRERGT